MYIVVLDNSDGTCYPVNDYVYLPGNPAYAITDASLEMKLNEAGSLSFSIYNTHPLYETFRDRGFRRLHLSVFRTDDGIITSDTQRFFSGEVQEVDLDNDGMISVYAVGNLSFTKDTLLLTDAGSGNAYQYVSLILHTHNQQCTNFDSSASELGNTRRISVPATPEEVLPESLRSMAVTWDSQYATIYDCLIEFCEQNDLYIKLTQTASESIPVLHLVKIADYFDETVEQPMYARINIVDTEKNSNTQNFYTCIVPIGKDGLTLGSTYGKDYIIDTTACTTYGYIWTAVKFDDIEDAATLYTSALNMLQDQLVTGNTQYTVQAIDLVDAGYDTDRFSMGSYIIYYSDIEEMSSVLSLPITKMTIDLLDPSKSKYVLGTSSESNSSATSGLGSASSESKQIYMQDFQFAGDGNSWKYVPYKTGYKLASAILLSNSGDMYIKGINNEGTSSYILLFSNNTSTSEYYSVTLTWILAS